MNEIGKRTFAVVLAATVALGSANASATTIDPDNYNYFMTIAPASGKVTSTLENFPILVRLSSARQTGFVPADCGANGADLRFALADGTLLAHEIDTWNPSGESLVWVNVPSLTSSTQIVAYWGVVNAAAAPAVNAADTWPDFVAVYHLNEGGATVYDSSGNGYTAVNNAAVSAGKNPKIGGCVSFSDHFVTQATNLTDTSAVKYLADRSKVTVTAWVAVDDFDKSSASSWAAARNSRVDIAHTFTAWGDAKGGFDLRYFENNGYGGSASPLLGLILNSGTYGNNVVNWNTRTSSTGGNWLHMACSMNGATIAKYVNGTSIESATQAHGVLGPNNSSPLKFGATDSHDGIPNSGKIVARLDELRIRGGAASAAWIAADYAQQNSDTFLDYGLVGGSFVISPIAAQTTTSAAELAAGIEPAVTVSNQIAGVELVQGTHYTVSYSDNHSFGVATATATGIGAYAGKTFSTTFVIHASKQIRANYSLTEDEDWSAFEAVDIGGVTIDLKGHDLTICGLGGYGQAIITDSVGGGELWIDVHRGYPVTIDYVQLTGKLKLVKTGPGTLTASKAGQTFSGGTRIVSGLVKYACSNKTIDDTHPFGYTSASDMGPITLEEGGILDPGGAVAWGNHTMVINGGMISNTVAVAYPTYGVFNPKTTVNGDFTFATLENYAWTVPNLAGHTATVGIGVGRMFYVQSSAAGISGGRFNVVRGGNFTTFTDKAADFSKVDLDPLNAAPFLLGPMSVHDFNATYPYNYGRGTVALNVYGTFTPASEYFFGPTMQDGSTIDLSAKTGTWSSTSLLTEGGNATTKFAAGAKVKIELGARKLRKGDKVISWTTQPDATFTSKKWILESRVDGLYAMGGIDGLVIIVR